MFQQTSTAMSSDDNEPRSKSKEMDPLSPASFGEVPPSACSTFTETDHQQETTEDDMAAGRNWTTFENAAAATLTEDSKDLAFMLTASNEGLVSDSAETAHSRQSDDKQGREELNGREPAADGVDDAAAGTWHHIDDDDDEVRKLICTSSR